MASKGLEDSSRSLLRTLVWLLMQQLCGCHTHCQATPGLLNPCITGEFTKFVYRFLYQPSLHEDCLVQQRTLLRIYNLWVECTWRWVREHVVSSDHLYLGIRSVWTSLLASCVCVWLKFECLFLRHSSPVQNAFVSSAKVFISSTTPVNVFVLYLEVSFKNPPKKNKQQGRFSAKLHFKWDGLEKRTETKQRWKNARRLPSICKNYSVDVG